MTDAAALERLLATRHSCRAFLPDRVPQPTIDAILALAQRTASWCNAQPWQVIVASGAATDRFRDALAQPAPAVPDLPFQIGRAHVRTPVTNAHLVCRLLLEKKKNKSLITTTDHELSLPYIHTH